MRFLAVLTIVASASAAVLEPRHHAGKRTRAKKNNNGNGAATSAATGAAAGAGVGVATGNDNNNNNNNRGGNTAAAGSTVVLFEVGGVPGNECLTFRNNGEIVDAACVNTAADRQVTPTTIGGESVLRVQRSFTAGFRPDLVGVTACVGFNGTHMLAVDCADNAFEPVTFTGGELRATSGACASGHDGAAQLTVDAQGNNCATFTSTTVTPTDP